MRFRRFLAGLVAGAALAGTAGLAAGPAGASTPPASTIADALAARSGGLDGLDRNPFDYDILIQAVLANDFVRTAATSPSAELTVFAPNDLAFRQLTADLTGDVRWLFRSEPAVVGALVDLFTKNGGLNGPGSLLETVLRYHVVAPLPGIGTITSDEVLKAGDGLAVPTLLGPPSARATFTVDVVNRFLPLVVLQDADRDDLDAVLAQTRLDIRAGASVVHGVTQVLRPADVGRLFESRAGNLDVAR